MAHSDAKWKSARIMLLGLLIVHIVSGLVNFAVALTNNKFSFFCFSHLSCVHVLRKVQYM